MAHLVPQVDRPESDLVGPCDQAGSDLRAGRCDPRVERTRQAVLAAAAAILEEQGWEAVTHVAVSERSGVGRSTLYRHWPDATSLIIEVIAQRAVTGVAPLTGDLRRDLIAELERFRERLHDPACERGMVTVMERATVDPTFAAMRGAITADATKSVRAALLAAGEHGELDLSAGVDVLIAQLAGPLAFRRLFARHPLTEGFVEKVVDGFLAAYGTKPRP